ncbi:MAG: MFS transporter [Bacteroidetes bacterium]|nr:MFS transporter [Bacteroidota bacterium]MBS1973363.1 MFS transporter [Bacteroidota bacterium]
MVDATLSLYKNAYTGLSKKTWYLSLVMLVNRSGTMVVAFLTVYCNTQLHFSIQQSGFIVAIFGAGAIIGAYLGGKIIDAWGFYPLQVVSLLLGGIMFIVVGYLKTFASLSIGVLVLSICNESFRPANSTAIAHYSSVENRTRSFSLNRLAINLGWAVGSALGGFLASFNYHLLFWADGITNILSAILLLKLLPYIKTGRKQQKGKKYSRVQSPYRDKVYRVFIVLTILFASCFFQLFTMISLYFKTQWHLNEMFIGLLMAINGLVIVAIEMVLVYVIEGTKPHTFFIGVGVATVGAGFMLLNVMPHVFGAAVACIVIITIGEIMSMPFMNSFWISRTSEHNRGQYAAMYTIAWSTAQIAGPGLGGEIIAHKSYSTLLWALLAICLAASFGYILLGRYSGYSSQLSVKQPVAEDSSIA